MLSSKQLKETAVADLTDEQIKTLLRDARHRIANLSRAAVPFDDPLDGPVLRRLDAALAAQQPTCCEKGSPGRVCADCAEASRGYSAAMAPVREEGAQQLSQGAELGVPLTAEDVAEARRIALECAGSALLSGSSKEAKAAFKDRAILYRMICEVAGLLLGDLPQPSRQALEPLTEEDRSHIANLTEIVRMPNAEYVADAHNAAVRHLKRLTVAPAAQGGGHGE